MGYSMELFVAGDAIDPELICPICHDPMEDPVYIVQCEHLFCRKCLTEWTNKSLNCPIDRKTLTKSSFTPAPRPIRNMLDKLEIKCQYFQSCNTIMPLGELDQHLRICKFVPQDCKYGCGVKLDSDETAKHNCSEYLYQKLQQPGLKKLSDADKLKILQRARAARNTPKVFQNHMSPVMTQNVVGLVNDSIASQDHWWGIANNVREKLDCIYGPYWGCCVAVEGYRNVAVTTKAPQFYLDYQLADLAIFVWKNA